MAQIDHEQPDADAELASGRDDTVRTWTQRYVHPIKYRRFTAKSDSGYPHIFLIFDHEPGRDKLPEAVFQVLSELKTLDGYPTGLRFVNDRNHGKVWRLPDNPVGRTVADIIDAKLRDLAHALQSSDIGR